MDFFKKMCYNGSIMTTNPADINRGSGTILPPKEPFFSVVNPENLPTYSVIGLPSSILGGELALWKDAAVDLERLGKLNINGKPVELSSGPAKVFEAILGTASSATKSPIENSLLLALPIAHLMSQATFATALKEIGKHKKIYPKNAPDSEVVVSDYALQSLKSATDITFKKGTFRLEKEVLFKMLSMENPEEDHSYFKAKLILSGKNEDLKQIGASVENFSQISKNMDVKIVYTKEEPTFETALKKNYFHVPGSSLVDRKTYI